MKPPQGADQIRYSVRGDNPHEAYNESRRNTPADKKVRMIINLESQAKDDPGYPLIKRALYYCGRLMARQKHPRMDFSIRIMEQDQKVCSIWICIVITIKMNDVIKIQKRVRQKDMACRKGGWRLAHSGHGVSKEEAYEKRRIFQRRGRAGG